MLFPTFLPRNEMPRDILAYQRQYFARPERTPGMRPGATPYVLRHFQELSRSLNVPHGARVLELGAGMGRFSLLLAGAGYEVTACDLAPELLEVARANDQRGALRLVVADAARVDEAVDGPFASVVGFFFLHHVADLRPVFAAAKNLLTPGGRVVFCEPNAWNPAFYAQILLSRRMTWRGDGGVRHMRPGRIAAAARAAGLVPLPPRRYGVFPPAIANRPLGARIERMIERVPGSRSFLAFQIVGAARG